MLLRQALEAIGSKEVVADQDGISELTRKCARQEAELLRCRKRKEELDEEFEDHRYIVSV